MDAIDLEADASLFHDEDIYYEDEDDDESTSGSYSGEPDDSGEWDYDSEDYDVSDVDSDELSQHFQPHDLQNPKTFPSYADCAPTELYDQRDWNNELMPPPRHWCYLGEIVEKMTAPIRNILTVKDKAGKSTHLSANFDLEAQFDVKVGSTIAVLYAEKKYFSLGHYGLRLDHAKFVKIFPCNLETLLRINDDIESGDRLGFTKKCNGCGKAEEAGKTKLLRCSRCFGVSYCGKACQSQSWKQGHKGECKVLKDVIELKRSRNWGNRSPLKWIAFGEHEELHPVDPAEHDPTYRFQTEWKDAEPAVVKELSGTFTIVSGELVWGQLTSILNGLMTQDLDFPTTVDKAILDGGGTVITQGYTFRAPAKVGIWKIAKVDGYGYPGRQKDSWLAYHSSYEALELLLLARSVCWETRNETPRVCWVNRYDWGSNCVDLLRMARVFADIDPGSDWATAIEQEKQRQANGNYRRKGNPDNKWWDRLETTHASHNTFLVDALKGPEVLKLIASPSRLETHLERRQSSSFFENEKSTDSLGCNLAFMGSGWEFARLIFSKEDSTMFPGKKELIGFWYDQDNRYNYEDDLKEPVFENI